ncbi:MAG TPA: YfiR family protein [Holophagaceae bacterium]|nr:YfiR family protein [Holophagaceae bacterium]
MRATRLAAPLVLAGILPCLAAPQEAQPEFAIKARFLLQFPEFISWPPGAGLEDPSKPFIILVLGDSPFGDRLDQAAQGRKAQGHPVEIRYSHDAAALDGCHMVFICASERGRLGALLARAAFRPILTVADTEGFAEQGVMINLVIESSLPRFEINRAPARGAGLSLSAQLLGLARKVL